MDTSSVHELYSPTPKPGTPAPEPVSEPSIQSDEISVTSLITWVEEFQKRDVLERLEALTVENASLQQQIIRYQKNWCALLDLLQKIRDAVRSLHSSLRRCADGETTAEREWLAFWGISDGAEENPGPGSWI
jgi:hypothetical protein